MYCKNEKRRARTGLKRIDVLEPAVEMPMTEEVSSSELKYEQGTSGRLRNVCWFWSSAGVTTNAGPVKPLWTYQGSPFPRLALPPLIGNNQVKNVTAVATTENVVQRRALPPVYGQRQATKVPAVDTTESSFQCRSVLTNHGQDKTCCREMLHISMRKFNTKKGHCAQQPHRSMWMSLSKLQLKDKWIPCIRSHTIINYKQPKCKCMWHINGFADPCISS
jgi:hypothetical protein